MRTNICQLNLMIIFVQLKQFKKHKYQMNLKNFQLNNQFAKVNNFNQIKKIKFKMT